MPDLWATTLLGDNTEPMLRQVVARLRHRGIRVDFDADTDHDARLAAARAGEYDLVWACGLLTVEALLGSEARIVAAPVFADESEPVYRSVIITRAGADEPRRWAVNEFGSWSGYHGVVRDGWLIDDPVITGSHVASTAAVRGGQADVAAIDHTIWDAMLAETPSLLDELAVSAVTTDWPSPPLVAGADVSPDAVDALLAVDVHRVVRFVPADEVTYRRTFVRVN